MTINGSGPSGRVAPAFVDDHVYHFSSTSNMPPRRARDTVDVWDDFDAPSQYDNGPDLVFSVSTDGQRLNCRAVDFVPPPPKRRKVCELDAAHRSWNPMGAEDDDGFDWPACDEHGDAPGVQLCDEPAARKRNYGVSP